MKYFGRIWPSGICDDGDKVETPVGRPCLWCGEEIVDGDQGIMMSYMDTEVTLQPMHKNCMIRQTVGSVARIERHCSCFVPGSEEEDPPGMTRREAADAAVEAWERQQMIVAEWERKLMIEPTMGNC